MKKIINSARKSARQRRAIKRAYNRLLSAWSAVRAARGEEMRCVVADPDDTCPLRWWEIVVPERAEDGTTTALVPVSGVPYDILAMWDVIIPAAALLGQRPDVQVTIPAEGTIIFTAK